MRQRKGFLLNLSETEKRDLERLAEHFGDSQSGVLRNAIQMLNNRIGGDSHRAMETA